MRSKLGTKSRLAAHILALILLIFMLVYTSPDTMTAEKPQPRRRLPSVSIHPDKPGEDAAKAGVGTLDRVHTPAVATRVEPEALRPPAEPGSPRPERPAPPAPGIAAGTPAQAVTLDSATPLQPHAEPLRPPATPAPEPESAAPAEPEAAAPAAPPDASADPGDAIEPEEMLEPAEALESAAEVVEPETVEPETAASGASEAETAGPETLEPEAPAPDALAPDALTPETSEPETAEPGSAVDAAGVPGESDAAVDAPVQPPMPQPDESGSLVVAESEAGPAKPVAAATPLPNANLEVLGDGVYWLDPGHDLEQELAAVPELRRLVILAPLPGYRAQTFPHVKTDVIPADPADLTRDAADQFLHLTGGDAGQPVAVAVLPGARGAAFFKGAYLLSRRAMPVEEVLHEIAPELEDAGAARDDIIHRLMRFKD